MANREPIQYIEIDVDYCTLTYATGVCTAVLGTTGTRKCFNTFNTCQDQVNFNKGVKTLRFINNRSNLPKGLIAYPVLKDNGISAFSSTVNIAGSDDKLGAFGRRATVTVDLDDFLDDDIYFDKYQLERISGAAQYSGIGYTPKDNGTFFSRLKARWPHYANRPMRIIDGYVDGGVLTVTQTRHYIITTMDGPDSGGSVSIEGKDVLSLADDKKATVPVASKGKLGSDITVDAGVTFDLIPAGIGAEYAASGWATIGSEIVSFTRSSDTITVVSRGLYGTTVATHSTNDSFQEAYNVQNMRVDDLIYDLLVNYANVDSTFCPLVAEWEPEITTWLSGLFLDTVIAKPTGVAQLIGELAVLGIAVWWDDIEQKIKLMATHPVTTEQIYPLSDRNNIKKITQEDNDEARVTQVHFYTRQTDPTLDYKRKDNYNQINVIVDADSENSNAYGTPLIKEVFCRWINNGADAFVRVLALRLLKRFNTAPKLYTILLDVKDRDIQLTTVIELDSYIVTDEAGVNFKTLLQAIKRVEKKSGHELEITAQAFKFDGRYGYIMANTTPVFSSASDAEKLHGGFFANNTTLKMSDGSNPYTFI